MERQAQRLTEIWILHKNGHEALCELFTHPIGGEIRVTVDGDMMRTEAGRNGAALVDLALIWKTQFEQKGWTA